MKKMKNIFKKKEQNDNNSDLTRDEVTISSLEEVSLTEKKQESYGTYLIKKNGDAEGIKNVLLIGKSGNGKSALANVISNTNEFKESGGSTSETRVVQNKEFEENETRYRIIDTPGIGDTKLKQSEVLDIIAEAVYLAKDGISQVFFVAKTRFDQSEMETYDILRTIIFDKEVTNHTTIIRTSFKDFKKPTKCQEDINLMVKKAKDRIIELKSDIAAKEGKLKNMSLDGNEHKKIFEEIGQLKKELMVTNLAEVIKSCQRRVVHVDNPPVEIAGADKEELELNKKKRVRSREIVLEHLKNGCQEDYKPEKLAELSKEIISYMESKTKLKKELENLSNHEGTIINGQISKIESNEIKSENLFLEDNTESFVIPKQERQVDGNQTFLFEDIEFELKIKKLENEKKDLLKEIQVKEELIRQKVLKHILNNYESIANELVGNSFINNIAKNNDGDWETINKEFADKRLILEWQSNRFDYHQVQKWVTILKDSFSPLDIHFYVWLRDIRKFTTEDLKRVISLLGVKELKKQYHRYLKGEIKVLDARHQQLGTEEESNSLQESENWTDLHPDFGEETYYLSGKTIQKEWEEWGFIKKEAEKWIESGFRPREIIGNINYNCLPSIWKSHGFTLLQVREWIKIGLKRNEYDLATHLRTKSIIINDDNVAELRKEFYHAESYLDLIYPISKRSEIKEINIGFKRFKGSLIINGNDWPKLEKIKANSNQLIVIQLLNCPQLTSIDFENNQLTVLVTNNCPLISYLNVKSNFFINLDLSQYPNLIELDCSNNQLTNLSFLQTIPNKEKLTVLDISHNEIKVDLVFLKEFKGLERILMGRKERDQDKIQSRIEVLPK